MHAGIDERALVDAVKPRDLAVLAGEQRPPVEARLAHRPAVRRRDLEVLAKVRRIGEELLRDAADVDAGAAEAAGLGDGDARAVPGGDAARAYAARSAPYGEEVEVVIQALLTT